MSLKGADRHRRRLKTLSGDAVIRIAGAIVYEGADAIKAEAQHLITAGSVQGKGHIRSKPGEPPNREFGTLDSHIEARKTGPLTAETVSSAPHARPLEFGTSKMAARPYMRPARDKKAPEIQRNFTEKMTKLVKASGR